MAANRPLREIARPFVAGGPSGVSIRDRLKGLTPQDEKVLRAVGGHMGRLASRDLARRCADALTHSSDRWAARKRDLTADSSSRWAGSVTSHTHDQWGLSRRAQWAHLQGLDAGIRMIRHRLSLPVGEPGSRGMPGDYRSRHEWFHKTRRLAILEGEYQRVRAEREAGRVLVGAGRPPAAQAAPPPGRRPQDRGRLAAGAGGLALVPHRRRRIRQTARQRDDLGHPRRRGVDQAAGSARRPGQRPHGRYVLAARGSFPHRGEEWRDRVTGNRAVAYRIHYDLSRGRWYLDANWTRRPLPVIPWTPCGPTA
jgi:hypothetical protein